MDFVTAQLVSDCKGLAWGSLKECIERELNTVVSYGGSQWYCDICYDEGFFGCLGYKYGTIKADCCIDRDGTAERCVAASPAGGEEVESAGATVNTKFLNFSMK